jgi:hypothetical protein
MDDLDMNLFDALAYAERAADLDAEVYGGDAEWNESDGHGE